MLMGDDEGERDGASVADVALSALPLPRGTVSQLISQICSVHVLLDVAPSSPATRHSLQAGVTND